MSDSIFVIDWFMNNERWIHSRYKSLTCGRLVISCLQVARKDNSLMVHEWSMIQ